MSTTGKFIRLNATALQQIIAQDINSIGSFYEEGFQVILNDVLGFTDGIIYGLVPTEDDNSVYIAAGGRLIQDGIIGTSLNWSEVITKPSSGYRTDIIVAQVKSELENYIPRTFLVSPDADDLIQNDTYIEEVKRVAFRVIEGDTATPDTPPVVPAGWILLANLTVTSTDLTLDTSVAEISNAVEAQDFLTDINSWLQAQGYLSELAIFVNGSKIADDLNSLNLIAGNNITLTASEDPVHRGRVVIDGPDGGTVSQVTGTTGSADNVNELQFVAGSNMVSVTVNKVVDKAVITLNAVSGSSTGGFLEYAREYQMSDDGVYDSGTNTWRFTLNSITYTPGDDKLECYLGGQLLRKGLDYNEVGPNTVDFLNDPGTGNTVTFIHYGDAGTSAITGIDVTGTYGAGATDVQTLNFTLGGGIENVVVTESALTPGVADIEVDIVRELYNGSNADHLHWHNSGQLIVLELPRQTITPGYGIDLYSNANVGNNRLLLLNCAAKIWRDLYDGGYIPNYKLQFKDGTDITYLNRTGYFSYFKSAWETGGYVTYIENGGLISKNEQFFTGQPLQYAIQYPPNYQWYPFNIAEYGYFDFSLGDMIFPTDGSAAEDMNRLDLLLGPQGYGLKLVNDDQRTGYISLKLVLAVVNYQVRT